MANLYFPVDCISLHVCYFYIWGKGIHKYYFSFVYLFVYLFLSKFYTQSRDQSHDPDLKTHMLYQLTHQALPQVLFF